MVFLGIYRAIYDYVPQSDNELAIKEGDLLFVIEKSADDDWWKAKKKAADESEDEPEGLIPNNYVEEVSLPEEIPNCQLGNRSFWTMPKLLCPCWRSFSYCSLHFATNNLSLRRRHYSKLRRYTIILDRPMKSCLSARTRHSTYMIQRIRIGH
jgi:hypothetical protein